MYGSRASPGPAEGTRGSAALGEGDLLRLLAAAERATGARWTAYRRAQMGARLRAFLSAQRLPEAVALQRLAQDPGFVRALRHALTVHLTGFYRDPGPWRELAEGVRRTPLRRPWRVWSAGVANGAEAISLVGLFWSLGLEVEVLATDVDSVALEEAGRGEYPDRLVADLGPGPRSLLLEPISGGRWRVRPEVRRRIVYRELDLLSGAEPEGPFDLIACRNVLIYFTPEEREAVLGALGRALGPEGLLLLGATEVILSPQRHHLRREGSALYRRCGPPRTGG